MPDNNWPQVPPDAEIIVEIPGSTLLNKGWILHAELVANAEAGRLLAMDNDDPSQAWLDLDVLKTPLYVRGRRSGDRFAPLGMGGKSMKVADFMINTKLPMRARAGWPLIISGEKIAWVIALRQAHPYRIRPQTSKLLHLRLENQLPN